MSGSGGLNGDQDTPPPLLRHGARKKGVKVPATKAAQVVSLDLQGQESSSKASDTANKKNIEIEEGSFSKGQKDVSAKRVLTDSTSVGKGPLNTSTSGRQSLLCAESMLRCSPPGLQRTTEHDGKNFGPETRWPTEHLPPGLVIYSHLVTDTRTQRRHSSTGSASPVPTHRSAGGSLSGADGHVNHTERSLNLNHKKELSNVDGVYPPHLSEKRMNSNGVERGRMTGTSTTTSETIPWLISTGQVSQAQTHRPQPGILTTSDSHTLVPQGSLFRPSTLADPSRAYASQFAPLYTCAATTLSPYSPTLYAGHGQASHLTTLGAYSPYYPQYPSAAAGYSHGMLGQAGSHFPPHVESYSALIANMTSQIQHSSLPRSYLQGHLPQYSHLTGTGSTGSPGPAPHRPLTPAQGPPLTPSQPLTPTLHAAEHQRREVRSPTMRELHGRHPSASVRSTTPPHDMRLHPRQSPGLQHPGHGKPSHHSQRTSPHSYPSRTDYPGREIHGLHPPHAPGSRETSRKQKYSQRPPDIHIESLSLGNKSAQGYIKTESTGEPGPSPKRPKGPPPPLHPSGVPSHTAPSSGPHSHHLPPPPPLHSASYPPPTPQPHYPPHFMKGSIIQLANGELKRVEDLRTEDFSASADISSDLRIDSSTLVRIEEHSGRGTALLGFSVGEHKVQVTVEATLEHPFFVFGQGWSSCQPHRTLQRYGLPCQQLKVGDVCISLTHKDANTHAAELSRQKQSKERHERRTSELGQTSLHEGQGHSGQGHLGQLSSSSSHLGEERLPLRSISSGTGATEVIPHTQKTESVPARKRRWSAPDQFSAEGAAEQGSTDPQQISSQQSLGDNRQEKSTSSSSTLSGQKT